MASYGISSTEALISFSKELSARHGAASIEAYGTKDPAVLQALINNQPFPAGDRELGVTRLRTSSGVDINFSVPSGTVKFSAEGGGFAALGIYHSGKAAVSAMELDERLAFDLPAPQSEPSIFLVQQWGYDLAASGNGTVALGPVPVEFGIKGTSHGKYVVIRRVAETTPARAALGSIIDSWTVPALVKSAGDIDPGTWIVAEVDGSIALNIAANYGYNFNWVREASFGGLQGSIGLKVQAALSAALGFDAAGAYLLALGRETADPKLRLRLYRQKKNGFSFALHAGVTVEPMTGPFTKDNFNQLILAVLGVHHQQLVQDLQLVRDWAGGATPLSGIFRSVGGPYVEEVFKFLASSPAGGAYESARKKVSDFLRTWGGLDQKVTTGIWHLIGGNENVLREAKAITEKIAAAESPQDYFELLNQYLPQASFLVSPLGQWLETLASDSILQATRDTAIFEELQHAAQKASELLDAAIDPGSVLRKLHEYVDQNVGLKRIQDIADEASLKDLDDWVLAKIAAFVDQDVATLDSVKRVQEVIKLLFDKEQWFFDKAAEFLQKKYEADFAFTYQKATTRDALLDIEFDFSTADPSAQLTSAIRGRFDEVLLKPIEGVTLNSGLLSHEIQRNSDVHLTLPYFTFNSNHLNTSLARISSKQGLTSTETGLNVDIDVHSEDKVTVLVNGGGCVSHLALSSAIHLISGSGINSFGDPDLEFSYTFRKASRQMSRAEFLYQLGPQLALYLPNAFAGQRVSDWAAELDNAVPYGKADHIGDVLFRLQLAYNSRLLGGWFNAPVQADDARCKRMSYAIQACLKRLIPQFYFASRSSFDDIYPAYVLAVYSSIQPAVDPHGVHWDFLDDQVLAARLSTAPMQSSLRKWLAALHEQAVAAGSDHAEFYEESNLSHAVSYSMGPGKPFLRSLLGSEAAVVEAATEAGVAMAKFKEDLYAGRGRVAEALQHLADFGSKITTAFNANVQTLFGGEAVRAIGSAVYAEAAQTLGNQPTPPAALAELIVLTQNSGFNMETFLTGIVPSTAQVLLDQSVVNA